MSPSWSPLLTTFITAVFTAILGFYTARCTASVQQQAANHQAHSSESERAWERVDTNQSNADKWFDRYEKEHDARKDLEVEVRLLKAEIEALKKSIPAPSPPAVPSPAPSSP